MNWANGTNGRCTPDAPERVAVVRALPGLGDFLCAVPAWRALRAGWPDAHISLIGLPPARPLVERFRPLLDDWLAFPGFPGIDEGPRDYRALPDFLTAVRDRPFDLVLQMHGSGVTSNAFATLLGGRRTAGFYLPGHYCPDARTFLPYPDDRHEIRRLLQLVDGLGLPPQGEELSFPITPAEHEAFERLAATYGLEPGAYAVVHAGASRRNRRWPALYFVAVADALAAAGLPVVLTGGPRERRLTGAIAREMTRPVVDLAGQTSLGTLAALLGGATVLVCNDTGVSHLAAATRTPSVVIFTGSDHRRWAPLDVHRHRVIGAANPDAGPGQRRASPQVVLDEISALLGRSVRETAYA